MSEEKAYEELVEARSNVETALEELKTASDKVGVDAADELSNICFDLGIDIQSA